MKNTIGFCFLALVSISAAACEKTNPDYCNDTDRLCASGTCDLTTHGCVDGPQCSDVLPCTTGFCVNDACQDACTDSAQCAAAAKPPLCETDVGDPHEGQCVACLEDADCAGTTPVCDADACRGCQLDSDCPSQVCLPTGACADEAHVLYTAPGGGNTATCARGDECSLEHAVTLVGVDKGIVKLTTGGNYATTSAFDLSKDLTLLGSGATIDRQNGTSGPVVTVTAGSPLIYDVTITGGHGTGGDGVDCSGAAVDVIQSTISVNAFLGIKAANCALGVYQSQISSNAGIGGIDINGGTFDLVNDDINANGGTATSFGGVSITNGAAGDMKFNTIAKNIAGSNLGAGVHCATNDAFANNIIGDNLNGIQTDGNCTYGNSLIDGDLTGTYGVEFVDPDTGDFRLKPTSTAAIDQATADPDVIVDFDNDPRPTGAASDIGADEYVP